MAEAAEIIDRGAAALPAVNRYFPIVVSLLLLVGGGFGVWKFMEAEVEVLRQMSQHLADLDNDLKIAGVPVGWTKNKRDEAKRAVNAAAKDPE